MDKVEALEWVILLDAAKHVDAALLAHVALDRHARVEHVELVGVGHHLDEGPGHGADNGEERALGLPALCATAGVVLHDVFAHFDLHWVVGAVALESASRETVVALDNAVVDDGV